MASEDQPKRFQFIYGIIMLRTQRFKSLMDRLGHYRISKPVGWALLYLMPVAAAIGMFVFLTNLEIFFSPSIHTVGTAVRSISPLAYLGLPGINPYIPVVDGWAALFVAMIIHEGAHGVVARSLGFPVKSSGLLFFLFVPIGAFVEVDEPALKAAKARDSGRILAAGAGVNFIVGILFLLLLFNVISTMAPAADGIGVATVDAASPASAAGIQHGDFILKVNGISFNDGGKLLNSSWYRPGEVVNLTIYRQGTTLTIGKVTLVTNPANSSLGYLGITSFSYADLQGRASSYPSAFFTHPFTYFCIPSFPRCQDIVPFSDELSAYYTSSYGPSLMPLANLFYWMFFLNFNLAIFNAMPIYPLDGGQAFEAGLKGLARGKLSENSLRRITSAVTAIVIFMVISLPLAAYLNLI